MYVLAETVWGEWPHWFCQALIPVHTQLDDDAKGGDDHADLDHDRNASKKKND